MNVQVLEVSNIADARSDKDVMLALLNKLAKAGRSADISTIAYSEGAHRVALSEQSAIVEISNFIAEFKVTPREWQGRILVGGLVSTVLQVS